MGFESGIGYHCCMSYRRVGWFTILLGLFLLSGVNLAREIGDVKHGEKIYRQYCEECHGADGRGTGPRAPFLSPRPGNFVSAATSAKTDQELLQIIEEGIPRTAMKGWKTKLSKQDRIDVLAYIRSLVHFQRPSLTPPPPGSEPDAARATP